ncbi:hypothetical protein [Dactylosporangium sp. CA-092794]|uniref:hypothetical protein n=1 Tax=Dactylosporangium sp. CA-092794 TaxID=3239929 RepID=UPI003D8C6FA7
MRDDYDSGDLPGHDAWQPVDHSPIQVNVASLADYVKLVGKELEDYNENLKSGVLPMMRVQSAFAGFGEGKLYRGTHAKAVTAVTDLLKDVSFSLNSVAQAALGIYYEYIGGDDLGKAKVDDVYDVFWPSDGRPMVQDDTQPSQPETDPNKFTGSASTTDYLHMTDPATVTDPGDSYFNTWDQGFTVGDGGNKYDVYGNQSDMMGAPADPLKPQD